MSLAESDWARLDSGDAYTYKPSGDQLNTPIETLAQFGMQGSHGSEVQQAMHYLFDSLQNESHSQL